MDDSGTDPATAFELVGDETRLAILRALADHRRERGPDEWPTFADLRKRAEVGDASNFNYHLDRLLGGFVEKRDGAYRLTYQGHFVVSSLLAGTYETDASVSLSVDSDCPFCGRPQRATFDDGTVAITCPADHSFTQDLPPGTAAERSAEDLLALTALEMRTNAGYVIEGVCADCYGTLATELRDGTGMEGVEHLFVADCTRCGQRFGGPPAFLSLAHPAVVSFYRDHGVDLSERPCWTVPFPDHEVRIVSESPPEVRVVARLGDGELRVTMNGEANVVETERA
jgi:DNA-binding transcriptional ArsR family regulator